MIPFIANLYQVSIGIFKKKELLPKNYVEMNLKSISRGGQSYFSFFFWCQLKIFLFIFFNLLIGTGDREATDLEVKWEDATHISRYQI